MVAFFIGLPLLAIAPRKFAVRFFTFILPQTLEELKMDES